MSPSPVPGIIGVNAAIEGKSLWISGGENAVIYLQVY